MLERCARTALALFLLVVIPAKDAMATSPKVLFDVEQLVCARPFRDFDLTANYPNDQLVILRVPVTVIARTQPDETLAEVWIRIESADSSMRVVDYLPRTTMMTNYVGPVQIQQQGQQSRELEFQFQAASPSGVFAGARGHEELQQRSEIQGQQFPPMELCAASGTVGRGQGVYFKLRPTARTTVEGQQELTVVFQVPGDWRGDRVFVHCEAFGLHPSLVGNGADRVSFGKRSFVVATYLQEDLAARAAATAYVAAETDLRQAASELRKKSSTTNPLEEIGALLRDRKSPPRDWMERLVYSPSIITDLGELTQQVPSNVRRAAQSYLLARRCFDNL